MPDKDKLIGAIDSYAAQSQGSDAYSGELSRQRSLAIDAFAGKNFEPAPEGRSQVVDYTVFETIQWIMPSLMRIFAGGDKIVEFDPVGPDDEETAEQESEVLNYYVTQKNDWEKIVREFCQDSLLTKNAYCYAFMDETLQPEKEYYEGQTEEQVALILEDDVEVVGQRQYDDPDDEGTPSNPLTGQPLQSEEEALALMQEGIEPILAIRQLFDIEVKRVKASKKLCFKVLPPERVRVGNDTSDYTLDDCNFFEYWDIFTISDLRKMGIDVDDDVGDDSHADTREDSARDEVLENDIILDGEGPMRQVVCRFIWIRHDYDEDGLAELQYVVRVGNEILDREEVTRIPVASIVPFINTHRHMGMSVADVVFEIQRIKTALTRAGLDGLNLALNPRHYVNENAINENTISDLIVSRPGGVVRGDGFPGESIMPLQTENTFPFALQGLQHMDTVIESRAGVNRMFQGIDQSAMSSTNAHNAIGQLSTMAAQRVEDIARVFGAGFKRLFSIAHELIIKSGRVDETIKLRGEWVDIDPTQWRTGRDMRVVAPFAAGNKDALLQRLMVVAGIQERAFAAGLPIVDADDAYNLASEIAKAADLQSSKFFTDPATVEPEPEPPDYTMIALEVEDKKANNQAADSQLDAEVKKYEIDTEATLKQQIAQLNSETQIALAQLKEGQAINVETVRARLKDAPVEVGQALDAAQAMQDKLTESLDAIREAAEEVSRAASAPREIVREGGKVTGVKVNGEFKPLKRDSSGAISGV